MCFLAVILADFYNVKLPVRSRIFKAGAFLILRNVAFQCDLILGSDIEIHSGINSVKERSLSYWTDETFKSFLSAYAKYCERKWGWGALRANINCSSLSALLHCLPFSPPPVCRIFSFEPKSITPAIEANKASFRFCVLFIWSITMRKAQLAKIRSMGRVNSS